MKLGCVGLRQSGKTTIFNAITGQHAATGGYAIEQNLASVQVPDERLDFISSLYNPKKHTPAMVDFTDLPGIDPAADAKARNELLSKLRETDALLIVVRAFEKQDVSHPLNRLDPWKDLDDIMTDMILADLDLVERRLDKLDKLVRHGGKGTPQDKMDHEALTRSKEALVAEKMVKEVVMNAEVEKSLRGFRFLTGKPILLAINTGDEDPSGLKSIREKLPPGLNGVIHVCGKAEEEMADLSPEDRQEILKEYGLKESARERLIRASYAACNLISFFTYGEDECRAWTIQKGDTAWVASGKIHSDIQRGFIRAETASFADLKEAGDLKNVKKNGKFRLEGKTYVVEDGDIMTFRFNV